MISDILFSGRVLVELSIILVIYVGFRLDVMKGGILSFVLGFVHDCLACSISGLYTLIYVSVFLISNLASSRISPDKPFFIMVFTLICGLFEGIIIMVFHPLLYKGDVSTHALQVYMAQILITSGLSPIVFKAFNWIDGLLNGENKRTAERT
jgi:rod shape-determining protein MreD